MVRADTSDYDALARDYQTASGRLGKAGRAAIQQWANDTLAVQKANAPARTGALRADLSVEMRGDGRASSLAAIVGASAGAPRQSFFQEVGTSRMPAHPFIAPSELFAERTGPGLAEKLMDEVSDGL